MRCYVDEHAEHWCVCGSVVQLRRQFDSPRSEVRGPGNRQTRLWKLETRDVRARRDQRRGIVMLIPIHREVTMSSNDTPGSETSR